MNTSKDQEQSRRWPISRRTLIQAGVGAAMMGTSVFFVPRILTAEQKIPLTWNPPSNGSTDPYPIPWLDKNGSHNQSPGPGMEPSSIYHFKGHVARCNNFTGIGTDNSGNRISFGAPSTDFSFMSGEHFAARRSQSGIFSHI